MKSAALHRRYCSTFHDKDFGVVSFALSVKISTDAGTRH